MISLLDLLGVQSPGSSQSNGPLNLSMGPPWPDGLTSSLSRPTGFPDTAVQPGSMNFGGAAANDSAGNWSPLLPRLEALPTVALPQSPSGGILGDLPAVRANGAGGAMGRGLLQQYTDRDPGPSLQQRTLNASTAGPSRGLFSHPLSFSNLTTNLPLPPPGASWAAPQLPLFPTSLRDDNRNLGQHADDSAILSDAYPDPWIPNAQYASRARRGGRRASEPDLSPAEEIRWTIYNHNLDVLGKLEPQNRLLFSAHDGRWVPSPSDLQMLREEIERARREQGRSDIEPHHNLPREFKEDKFDACGLDIEDYVTYLARDLHRLRPDGLHTKLYNWNKVWRQYFAKNQTSRSSDEQSDDILEQLIRMWDNAQWLKR